MFLKYRLTIIGADYVGRRSRYCDDFVIVYVYMWVGLWVYYVSTRKPPIGMT